MRVANLKQGKKNIKAYTCSWHRDRGNAVCNNTLRRPVNSVDETVVCWIKKNILSEKVIVATLEVIRSRLRQRSRSEDRELPEIKKQIRSLKDEIDKLVDAITVSPIRPDSIIRRIAEREEQLKRLEARVEAMRATPAVLDMEVSCLEKEARRRLEELQELLDRNPQQARKAMETILAGPLAFRPVQTHEGPRYEIRGPIALGNLMVTEGFTTDGVPSGIRTRVTGVKGRRPGPD